MFRHTRYMYPAGRDVTHLLHKFRGHETPRAGLASMDWITIDEDDLLVPSPPAAAHLSAMPKKTPLNLVSIFGSARQGKSFLMNRLAGGKGCGFKVSNKSDPCTVGIDLCAETKSLDEFSEGAVSNENQINIGFVDAEGQGDRDTSYDARVACPILLASQCVLFNWKDSLQKDRMLNLLGVMTRAASSVKVDGGHDKCFGHLHIVFRDWAFDGDAAAVKRQLLEPETAGAEEDADRRNEVRRILRGAFESIHVWLLPPPVERTRDLQKVLKESMLSDEFKDAVAGLKGVLSTQLASPRPWGGRPVTGPVLAKLVPLVSEALNRDELILPKSAYEAMVRAEAEQLARTTEGRLDELCAALLAAGLEAAHFEAQLSAQTAELYANYQAHLCEIWNDASFVSEQTQNMQERVDRAAAQATQAFFRALWPLERKGAREALKALAAQLEAELPVEASVLRERMDGALAKITSRLKEAGARTGLPKAECTDTLEALAEQGNSLLEGLLAKSEAFVAATREAEAELLAQAQTAIGERMREEAASALPGRLPETRVAELEKVVVDQLQSRLVHEHASTAVRVRELVIQLRASTRALEAELHQAALIASEDALRKLTTALLEALNGAVQCKLRPKARLPETLLTELLNELEELSAEVLSEIERKSGAWGCASASCETAVDAYVRDARIQLQGEKETAARQRAEAAAREIAEEEARLEQEQARLEQEQRNAAEKARLEREQRDAAEKARLERERREAAASRRAEAERIDREQADAAQLQAEARARQTAKRKAQAEAEAEARAEAQRQAELAAQEEAQAEAQRLAEEKKAAKAAKLKAKATKPKVKAAKKGKESLAEVKARLKADVAERAESAVKAAIEAQNNTHTNRSSPLKRGASTASASSAKKRKK
mmetsp:Transcript_11836/g.32001  ORF Transcript_11836/g.32001 Transcript_11836/m.32001 type:complete len:898 (-) Transcript_11836:587-3280(-)